MLSQSTHIAIESRKMDVKYINPFIESARNVFGTMLDCPIKRDGISLKNSTSPTYEVSAVIGLSGKVCGSVVFSLSRPVALGIVKRMLDLDTDQINADVADAIGELTNMIAGGAKASFAQYSMSLGLPNVIIGRNHLVLFPGTVHPLCVHFQTPWGPMALEVGLDTRSVDVQTTVQTAQTQSV